MNNSNFNFGHPCCTKQYPPASQIQAMHIENLDSEIECKNAIPYNLKGRKKKLTITLFQKSIEILKTALEVDIHRYEDILKRGDKAMSQYDLLMGYTAQRSGLPLKHNHICYNLGCLKILNHWLKKLAPVKQLENVKISQQMELF